MATEIYQLQNIFAQFVGREMTVIEGEYEERRKHRDGSQSHIKRAYKTVDKQDPIVVEMLTLARAFNTQLVFRGVETGLWADTNVYVDLQKTASGSYKVGAIEARYS